MMFDSVMPDFDLTTITGKQEFRKWFTGVVRNEIRSYTPEALGVSTTIGNVENTISNFSNVPTGIISPFGGLVAPDGWLLCNGSQVSQVTYASLYAVLGVNAYGTDSGGNFYLPDFKGRVVIGLGANGDVNSRLYSDNIADANRSPKHSHTYVLTADSGGIDHTHGYYQQPGYTAAYFGGSGIPRAADNNASSGGYPTNTGVASAYLHTHPVIGTVGVGSGLPNSMPYGVANYIIKT